MRQPDEASRRMYQQAALRSFLRSDQIAQSFIDHTPNYNMEDLEQLYFASASIKSKKMLIEFVKITTKQLCMALKNKVALFKYLNPENICTELTEDEFMFLIHEAAYKTPFESYQGHSNIGILVAKNIIFNLVGVNATTTLTAWLKSNEKKSSQNPEDLINEAARKFPESKNDVPSAASTPLQPQNPPVNSPSSDTDKTAVSISVGNSSLSSLLSSHYLDKPEPPKSSFDFSSHLHDRHNKNNEIDTPALPTENESSNNVSVMQPIESRERRSLLDTQIPRSSGESVLPIDGNENHFGSSSSDNVIKRVSDLEESDIMEKTLSDDDKDTDDEEENDNNSGYDNNDDDDNSMRGNKMNSDVDRSSDSSNDDASVRSINDDENNDDIAIIDDGKMSTDDFDDNSIATKTKQMKKSKSKGKKYQRKNDDHFDDNDDDTMMMDKNSFTSTEERDVDEVEDDIIYDNKHIIAFNNNIKEVYNVTSHCHQHELSASTVRKPTVGKAGRTGTKRKRQPKSKKILSLSDDDDNDSDKSEVIIKYDKRRGDLDESDMRQAELTLDNMVDSNHSFLPPIHDFGGKDDMEYETSALFNQLPFENQTGVGKKPMMDFTDLMTNLQHDSQNIVNAKPTFASNKVDFVNSDT